MLREFSESLSGEVLSYVAKQNNLLLRGTGTSPCFQSSAAALRKVLRSHLPVDFQVSRGFIITRDNSSTLQEIIIHDRELKPAFAEGDLVFLTPQQAKVVVGIQENSQSETSILQKIQKLQR